MSTIKTILLDEDIEGLIKIGAPADEYNSEAVQIGSEIYKLQGLSFAKSRSRGLGGCPNRVPDDFASQIRESEVHRKDQLASSGAEK
jgi:hypothetical protein